MSTQKSNTLGTFVTVVIIAAALAGGYYWGKQSNANIPPAATCSALAQEIEKDIIDKKYTSAELDDCISKLRGAAPCANQPLDCCNGLSFCAISRDDLIDYAANYRDKVWSKTSSYFQDNPYNEGNFNVMTAEGVSPAPNFMNDIDSRFMTIDLEELSSYLCMIKNDPGLVGVNKLRCYFMRYRNLENSRSESNRLDPATYNDKNSMAFVPVTTNAAGETQAEFTSTQTNQLIWTPGSCEGQTLNHNNLCPPPRGCANGTLLGEVDNLGPR